MRAARLRSGLIERILFDEEASELTICFHSGACYLYANVPRALYDALKSAASAGAFFNACIKGRFPCRPLGRRFRPS